MTKQEKARHALRRAEVKQKFRLLSALHTGSGGVGLDAKDKTITDENGEPVKREVSLVHRGGPDNLPFIPGASLKGALKATTGGNIKLFGAAHVLGEQNHAARLTIFDAYFDRLPEAQNDGLMAKADGVFQLTRTKIEPGLKISDPNFLYTKEHVAPGAEFTLRLRLEAREDFDDRLEELKDALAQLAQAGRIALGADKASGFGRFEPAREPTICEWEYAADDLTFARGREQSLTLPEIASKTPFARLHLECESPYLVKDTEHELKKINDGEATKTSEESRTRALRDRGKPFVTGAAISAVIREKMTWRARMIDADVKDNKDAVWRRAFGTTSRAAAFDLVIENVEREAEKSVSSVRIDRFSGGVIDNALVTFDADVGVKIDVAIFANGRSDDDIESALTDALQDLARDGIELGLGSSGGFGWFEATISMPTADGGDQNG